MDRSVLAPLRADLTYGGPYSISGTVDRNGTVGRYRVVLMDRRNLRPIRVTVSDADGDWEFANLRYYADVYMVFALDHNASPENADISDFVVPE